MCIRDRICEAFAVSGDRLLYTGDCETAMTFKGDSTECIDLKGKTVLPGLGDAHLHASSTCELLFSFDMYNIGCLLYTSTQPTNR